MVFSNSLALVAPGPPRAIGPGKNEQEILRGRIAIHTYLNSGDWWRSPLEEVSIHCPSHILNPRTIARTAAAP